MKVILVMSLFLIIGCNSNDKKEENASMAGAYKMLTQNVKSDKTDTTYTSLHQLKIYTGDYMMYANFNSPDSVSGFGIGSYTMDKDTIVENVIYNASDTSRNDNPGSFKLVIEKTAKGYKQIIPDIISQGEHIKLTEEYETVTTATKSPLDGVWKQTKSYYVSGKDTTANKVTQFKTYYAGHVIWGNTYVDYNKKNYTAIGFGKFEMSGNNKVKESMTSSTNYMVRDHDFDIDVELNGKDGFTQTINNKDSSKSVEVYERVKK
jgi:hypothetical protein